VLIHLKQNFPKVKIVPVHKKPISSSLSHAIYLYYNKKHTFVYDKGKDRLIVGFKNAIVMFINKNENENKLLFSLACSPDWNDNKDINYSIITSELTIQKIREICNALYELSSKDTIRRPVILADKQVLAYVKSGHKFFYYKLIKSKKGLIWKKDGEMGLYNRSAKREAKYKQMEHGINDRYYVIGDQTVEIEGRGKGRYYMIYDEFRIYDLYKRKIIETASTFGTETDDPEAHEHFESLGISNNVIFFIKDKVIVRPAVYGDLGVATKIKIDISNDDENKQTIEINVHSDVDKHDPIVLFYSESECIVVTKKTIFIYDLNESLEEPSYIEELMYEDGINTKRVKLYKYKSFFILLDGYYLMAAYYNKKESQYYFRYTMDYKDNLHRFNIIGHLLSSDDDECIAVVLESPDHELLTVIYDDNKKDIHFYAGLKYHYPFASKKDIDLLLRKTWQEIKNKKFILQFVNSYKFLNDTINLVQKEGIDYLRVVVGEDVKVFRASNGSYLPLSPNEFYDFNFFSYILTHEQPCLVESRLLNPS
jgi:hypothetical protein